MSDEEFHLNEPITNDTLKSLGNKLGDSLGVSREPKCKGIRIFYVDKFDVLMSSGLFVKGFSPEDWDEDGE
jgi:hypothetical protein